MKKFLLGILCALCLICFVGCGSAITTPDLSGNQGANTNEGSAETITGSSMQKHVVALTLDNYQTYFDIQILGGNSRDRIAISGCLSYAYYENVTITCRFYTGQSNDIEQTETVTLNAHGNGTTVGAGYNNQIIAISGNVIYWM